ncbi:MAG: transporter [Betaproteobacteria bacterium]|nr:transporter [Betaproteobacteria bacterium]
MTARVPHRIGLYLAVVQFFFTLTWTVYVIYLPRLAAEAGIPKSAVVYILLLDQLVFVAMDYTMGLMADRVSRVLGKLGYVVLGVTIASCAAFLLLPFVAPHGAAWLFLLLTVLWTVSSSALRAPPLVLVGKYAAQPSVPWLSALSLFGLGLASAISPYLAITLRGADPRIPFVLSSVALAAATLGIVWAERALARSAATAAPAPALSAPPTPWMMTFLFAVLLLGLGFQIHFSLNSATLYLRHAPASDIPYLMPVFWIGFNVLMLPASLAVKRYGGLVVAAAGALIAAVASLAAYHAGDLNSLIAAQFSAGGGWGCVLMSVVSAAIAIGHTGREGKMTGGLFSLLALATFARIAVLAAELNKDAQLAGVLSWAPVAAWALAGVLLLTLLPKQRKAVAAAG